MNRRDFAKALAGIPLLGLLVKLSKADEELHLIMPGDPDYVDISIGSVRGSLTCAAFDEELIRQVGPYITFDETGIRICDSDGLTLWQVSPDGTIA